jgi:hypothetical protein
MLETIGWRGLWSAMSDGWGWQGIRGMRFNERDMDGPNEFSSGEVENIVARAIIAIPNEHAKERFR